MALQFIGLCSALGATKGAIDGFERGNKKAQLREAIEDKTIVACKETIAGTVDGALMGAVLGGTIPVWAPFYVYYSLTECNKYPTRYLDQQKPK